MSTADILRRAKARIADPEHWCRWEFALDHLGIDVESTSDTACAWCALGALAAENGVAINIATYQPGERFIEAASMALHNEPMAKVNDTMTHADVMAVYDRAIELAEKSK